MYLAQNVTPSYESHINFLLVGYRKWIFDSFFIVCFM